MKIAYAVHHLPPNYTGGAEYRALRTARWFQSHGHAARLNCIESILRAEPARADSEVNGLPIRRLSFDYRTFKDGCWRYDNPLVEQRIAEFLDEERPDIFHLFSGYLMTAAAIRAARAAGAPIVISLTDFWFLCPRITLLRSNNTLCPQPPDDPMGCVCCLAEESRRFRWPANVAPPAVDALWRALGAALPAVHERKRAMQDRRRVLCEALAEADALVCPSRFLHDLFRERGVAADKLMVMRQGLATPPPALHRVRDPHRLTIGYGGQIRHHKGLDLLIRAAVELARQGYPFTLAIYGDESIDRRYTQSLKRLAGRVDWIEWRGIYAPEQIWDVLTGLDVIVVPSRWYENSPNIILEAQSIGVPVVATALGGMAELVQHDVSGLLFRLNDARDLARQQARLFDEPGLLNRLSAGAPAVKSLDQEMAELLDVYRHVSARSAPPATRESERT